MRIDVDFAEKIIGFLESVQLRPYMYVGGCEQYSSNPASIWLGGFNVALNLLGFQAYHADILQEVVAGRGYEMNAGAPDYEMKQRGMSEEEMVNECLSIEIEVWKRVLVKLQEEKDSEQG